MLIFRNKLHRGLRLYKKSTRIKKSSQIESSRNQKSPEYLHPDNSLRQLKPQEIVLKENPRLIKRTKLGPNKASILLSNPNSKHNKAQGSNLQEEISLQLESTLLGLSLCLWPHLHQERAREFLLQERIKWFYLQGISLLLLHLTGTNRLFKLRRACIQQESSIPITQCLGMR